MPSDLPAICRERAGLLREFSDAASEYAKVVREMAALVMSGQAVPANDARRTCRTAWERAEKSRLALYRHEVDHNCVNGANVSSISET
jgi:hypothetical protein